MLALGLVLMVLAGLLLLAGIFGAGDEGAASLLGIHLGATSVFLLGVAAGLALLFGFSLTKWGGKRQWRQTRERRRLEKVARRYDEVEAERAAKDTDPAPPDTPHQPGSTDRPHE